MSEVGDSVIEISMPSAEIQEVGDSVRVDIRSMLSQLHEYDPSNHKIAKVPDFLRGGNEEAYDPKIVSIGPIHHNKNHLQCMQQHKVWYLKKVLDRGNHSLEEYMKELGEYEDAARNYYSNLIELPEEKNEFLEMLLLDGVFVIELARKWSFNDMVSNQDYIFQYGKMDYSDEGSDHCNEELIQIRRDMLMIENQLPFFILIKLFEMTRMDSPGDNLHLLVLDFFRRIIPGLPMLVPRTNIYGVDYDHLLGLVYKAYFVDKTIDHSHYKNFKYHEINSTSELHEEGIKFKRAEGTTLMNVKFENGVIKIPKLEVGDTTESIFRNLIAYELMRVEENWTQTDDNHTHRYVTEYCFLMQFLVNSKKDVEILRRAGIVTNWMGDDEMVRLFFNKLTRNVASSQEFYYANIIWSMNKYCKQRRNIKKWWTIFLRKYINSPWSILSVVAAVILLFMTATNIAFAVLSYNIKRHDQKLH